MTGLFLVVFGCVFLLLARLFAEFLSAIVLALVLVSIFWPVFRFTEVRVGGRGRLAAGLTTILVVLGVVVPVGLFITSLSAQAYGFYRSTVDDRDRVALLVESVSTTIETPLVELAETLNLPISSDLLAQIPERLEAASLQLGQVLGIGLFERIGEVASNAVTILFHFGIMIVVLFSLFAEGEGLKAYLMDLSPLPDDEEERLVQRFKDIARAVFLGNGMASLFQGVAGGILIEVFDVGPGVLWGAVIGFLAFLPIIGASVVFVPVTVYMFFAPAFSTSQTIAYLALNFSYVAVLEYGLKPRLIGESVKLHAVLVFLGIVAGLSLFGILGLFYGPLIVTMFLTLSEIYKESYRDDLMRVVRELLPGSDPEEDATGATGDDRSAEPGEPDPGPGVEPDPPAESPAAPGG